MVNELIKRSIRGHTQRRQNCASATRERYSVQHPRHCGRSEAGELDMIDLVICMAAKAIQFPVYTSFTPRYGEAGASWRKSCPPQPQIVETACPARHRAGVPILPLPVTLPQQSASTRMFGVLHGCSISCCVILTSSTEHRRGVGRSRYLRERGIYVLGRSRGRAACHGAHRMPSMDRGGVVAIMASLFPSGDPASK